MLKLRIRSIDKDGYNGRDFPPDDHHLGLLVTLVSMESHYWNADDAEKGLDFEELVVGSDGRILHRALPVLRGEGGDWEGIVQMFTAVTEDGHVLQLMGHEVEIVGLING